MIKPLATVFFSCGSLSYQDKEQFHFFFFFFSLPLNVSRLSLLSGYPYIGSFFGNKIPSRRIINITPITPPFDTRTFKHLSVLVKKSRCRWKPGTWSPCLVPAYQNTSPFHPSPPQRISFPRSKPMRFPSRAKGQLQM